MKTVLVLGCFVLSAVANAANLNPIRVDVITSDGKPLPDAAVETSVTYSEWGLYAGPGEPIPTHLGWHTGYGPTQDVGTDANGVATTSSLEQFTTYKDIHVDVYVDGFLLKDCGNYSSIFEYPDTGYAVNIEQDCYVDSANLMENGFHCQLKLDYDTLMRSKALQEKACKEARK